MAEFDPAGHRMVPQQRWFEDFSLGERFVIPSRTMTAAVFAASRARVVTLIRCTTMSNIAAPAACWTFWRTGSRR